MAANQPTSQGKRIKTRRVELKLTQTAVARHIGVTAPTIGQWERQETAPNGQNVIRLAEILQVSPQWIIDGRNYNLHSRSKTQIHGLPLLPFSVLDKKFDLTTLTPGSFETRLSSRELGPESFALTMQGDAMLNPVGGPSLPEGAVIIVDPDRDYFDKSIVVAVTRKSAALCRRYTVDGPHRWLTPLNPKFTKLEFGRGDLILGTVVAMEMDLV